MRTPLDTTPAGTASHMHLAGMGRPEAETGPADRLQPQYSPLVTLQRGEGRSFPLFCVPGAGATAVDFLPLSSALGPRTTVHAFQARGLDQALEPHATVEDAAECYLTEVRNTQPRGKVTIVGHSFGGWIAFEMALQLEQQGREVQLVIVDSRVPGPGVKSGSRAEVLMMLVSLHEQALRRSLNIHLEQLQQRDPAGQLKLLHERLVWAGVMPARSRHEMLRGVVRSFEANVRTTYLPERRLGQPLRLILATDNNASAATSPRALEEIAAGWRELAPALRYSVSTGNHVTALRTPHLERWMAEAELICEGHAQGWRSVSSRVSDNSLKDSW